MIVSRTGNNPRFRLRFIDRLSEIQKARNLRQFSVNAIETYLPASNNRDKLGLSQASDGQCMKPTEPPESDHANFYRFDSSQAVHALGPLSQVI